MCEYKPKQFKKYTILINVTNKYHLRSRSSLDQGHIFTVKVNTVDSR
jgi:hypothetical protein